MGTAYGRNLIGTGTGQPCPVLSHNPIWRPVGITIDWGVVAAVSGSPVTVNPEGIIVPVGAKYLPHGQVMTLITQKPVQTITAPGSGTFTITATRPDTGTTSTSAAIAFNAATSVVQTALDGLYGAGNTVAAGSAGGPWTVTYQGALAGMTIPVMTVSAGSVANTTPGANNGKFGPYDFAATDGRQTLARDQCGILNETIVENGLLGFSTSNTTNVGLLEGGVLWKSRILMTTGTHSLAAGPTVAELEAVLPLMRYAGI